MAAECDCPLCTMRSGLASEVAIGEYLKTCKRRQAGQSAMARLIQQSEHPLLRSSRTRQPPTKWQRCHRWLKRWLWWEPWELVHRMLPGECPREEEERW